MSHGIVSNIFATLQTKEVNYNLWISLHTNEL